MNLDNLLSNLIEMVTKNPQLINNILSIFDNKQNIETPQQNQTYDNSYWTLPNYNMDIQNYEKSKSKQPQYKNYQNETTNQTISNNTNNLDIQNVIKVLSELLNSLKSQQKESVNTQTQFPNNSILNLTKT